MAQEFRIIGCGLAGLAAAVMAAGRGARVTIDEAAIRAGGRCRSYFDSQLGMEIDNGNHLLLSGNDAAMAFLSTIGAGDRVSGPGDAAFDFIDAGTRERWRIVINRGRLPWWVLRRSARVPGTGLGDYLGFARLMRADRSASIGEVIRNRGAVWTRLVEPLMIAALNVPAATGSAWLAGQVIAESIARGGSATRPLIAHAGLDAAFVTPALERLAGEGIAPRFGRRLRQIAFDDDRVAALDFGDGPEPVGDSVVILAVPSWIAADLVPDLVVPDRHSAIVNVHFAIAPPPGAAAMIGIIGGTAEWAFAFPDRIAITISAADALVDIDRAELARRCWADVTAAYDLPEMPMPPWQVVKEKRATFAATPEQDARRPGTATRWRNLFLAGDWTQTGLPATIEGAIRSGNAAATAALACTG